MAAAIVCTLCLAILLSQQSAIALGRLLLVTTFMSRVRVPLFGIEVLLEQAALVAVLVALVCSGRLSLVTRMLPRVPHTIWLFLAWGCAISLVRAPDPWASLAICAWLAASVVIAVLLAGLYDDGHRLIHDALSLGAMTAAIAVGAWVVAVASGSRWGVQQETITGTPAAYGLSFEANVLGGMAALWLLVAIFAGSDLSARRRRVVFLAFTGAIIASLTRAAILGVVAGVVTILAFGRRSGRDLARTLPILAALAVVALVVLSHTDFLAGFVEKSRQMVDLESATGRVRTQKWDQAVQDMEGAAWLAGQGVNSFGQRHVDPTRPGQALPAYLGNMPLQVLYDTGLVGFSLLATGVWTLVRRSREFRRPLGVLAAATVVGLATSPLWFGNLWVFAAIALCHSRAPTRRSRPDTVSQVRWS